MYVAGQVFGELTFLTFTLHNGRAAWKCKCICGNEVVLEERKLAKRKNKNCGICEYRKKYPLAYTSWIAMNQRCNDPKVPEYPRYGGRGITIDPRWYKFSNFLLDMGSPPICPHTKQRYTLDRINNDGNYTKSNCRWASVRDQNNNREHFTFFKLLSDDISISQKPPIDTPL